jgi:hypothetical protein
MQAEKNDVDLKPLFSWGKAFEVRNNKDEVVETLYMRLIGDADLNRARVFALRKSAEKRKALKTEGSDERIAFVPERGAVEKERLVSACALLISKDFAREAAKNVNVPLPKEPKADATTEQQERYQQQVDEYPAKLDKALKEYISAKVDTLIKEYEKLPYDELFDLYVDYFINELCEIEMYSYFKAMCTYYGTFKDEHFKTRYFESFDEFDNLETGLKEQFMAAYESLDINPDELKKLLVATR